MERQEINYPWSKAPRWAQWAATDQDGHAHWYEVCPIKPHGNPHWQEAHGRYRKIPNFLIKHSFHFRKSLQKRPTIDEINYPWDWAPKWANYAVILSNGDAYWLEQEPILTYSNWTVIEGRALPIGECSNPKHVENYELSLQKHPAK